MILKKLSPKQIYHEAKSLSLGFCENCVAILKSKLVHFQHNLSHMFQASEAFLGLCEVVNMLIPLWNKTYYVLVLKHAFRIVTPIKKTSQYSFTLLIM